MRDHSVIGPGCRIGFGAEITRGLIGDGVTLPAAPVLSPGTLIGPGTLIYPRQQVGGFLPTGSRER